MAQRLKLAAIFAAPIVFIGALWLLGLSIPVPVLGRDYVVRIELPDEDRAGLPQVYGPEDRSRPLVVIDPGHGGHDPGASGAGHREKDLVLGLALALRDELVEEGGVRVALTREDDRFLILGERFQIARDLKADLFISIHADSAGDFSGVRGASIYTLSNTASSEAAQRFADRENSADVVNGIDMTGRSANVSQILVELSQRRTQEDSREFSRLIERESNGRLKMHPKPQRSAALAVLRAPDMPSVLYEAGYITNPQEAQMLASETGRKNFAVTMSQAIRVFLARQSGP